MKKKYSVRLRDRVLRGFRAGLQYNVYYILRPEDDWLKDAQIEKMSELGFRRTPP